MDSYRGNEGVFCILDRPSIHLIILNTEQSALKRNAIIAIGLHHASPWLTGASPLSYVLTYEVRFRGGMSKADDLLTIGSISDSGCIARSRGYCRQSGRVVGDRIFWQKRAQVRFGNIIVWWTKLGL